MEEIDLKEMFDYFKSKISWIIITVVLAIGIGNIYTILTRVPMYRSDTSLVLVSKNNGEGQSYNQGDQQLNKNLVGTYTEIIKSKRVLEKVINNLDLDYTLGQLQSRISVASVSNSEIIKITASDPEPRQATKIANEIANVFTNEINKFYELNNVAVLDKAENAKSPYNVNYVKDNVIYLLVGIVLSCGIIFIYFYFDTTIKTSDDIEKKLGLNVIGTVPKVNLGKE